MTGPATDCRAYRFGEFTLDLQRGCLRKAGADIRLRPKSFEVLRLLVLRHGQLVTRSQLLDEVWADRVVTDGSITQCLIDARRAIGDDAQDMIRTLPRRGYIFDVPVVVEGPAESSPAAPFPRIEVAAPPAARWGGIVVGAIALLALVLVAWRADPQATPTTQQPSPITAAAPPPSIAVLPFTDMSAKQDQAHLSDGIAEEILNLLAQTPGLRVTARTSSFSFRGRNLDIGTIADQLKVNHVLEGSVRRSGDQIRITAQLIDADTGFHMWSRSYDRQLGDMLAVQAELASAVATALNVQLAVGSTLRTARPQSAEAYELFLQGLFFFNRRAEGDLQRAGKYYRQALAIDPRHARAWAGLAGVDSVRMSDGEIAPAFALANRELAVQRALALDPALPEAHVRAAQYYWDTMQFDKAEDHARMARRVGDEHPLVLAFSAGEAAWHGRLGDAIDLARRTVAVDPLSATHHGNLAAYLLAAGHLEEAKAALVRESELSPALPHRQTPDPAFILILQHRQEEALALLQQGVAGDDLDQGLALVHPSGFPEADAAMKRLADAADLGKSVRIAEVHAFRGEIDESFRWLQKADGLVDRSTFFSPDRRWIWQSRLSPFLRPLHADPRWKIHLARTDGKPARRTRNRRSANVEPFAGSPRNGRLGVTAIQRLRPCEVGLPRSTASVRPNSPRNTGCI